LEWLRLIFAFQVVVSHTSQQLGAGSQLPAVIANFPGVPAFFFVSGFLIYSSFNNTKGKHYFENRFLRLFPGLFLVTIGGGVVVVFGLGWDVFVKNVSVFFYWFAAQVTIGQAYNPELFRSVGIGVINGALWTITTEILFYLSVPVIAYLEKHFRYTVHILIALTFVIYALGPTWLNSTIYRDKSIFDLLALTPIVWGWMFGLGILAFKYYSCISPYFRFIPVVLIPMSGMMIWGDGVLFSPVGNRLGVLYFCCYAALILWFAFYLPVLRLSFDLSYGVYIWHSPIINLLIITNVPSISMAILLTLFISALSWFCVEKPMLKLKRQSIRPI
jgi:peptidoglycan/LPS O-acetylase OafA/YrhL